MSFINWGNETPAQLEARIRAEREWQVLVEQALNMRRQQNRMTSTAQAGVAGSGGQAINPDNTENQYVENDYVENYFL